MANTTRLILALPSGRRSSISRNQAELEISKKHMEWIEKGVSVRYLPRREYINCAWILTDRCNLVVAQSGRFGPDVLQLL